jgi:hypothetical protein
MNRVSIYTAYKRSVPIWEIKNNGEEVLSERFKELIKELWDMNVKALAYRYGNKEKSSKGNKEYIKNYVFEYEREIKDIMENDVKLLMKYFKSFCNYTYQCSEGNISKSKLYKEIEKYETELGLRIAQNIPEWHEGKWE